MTITKTFDDGVQARGTVVEDRGKWRARVVVVDVRGVKRSEYLSIPLDDRDAALNKLYRVFDEEADMYQPRRPAFEVVS